jgi:hypothetical protein
MVTYKDLYGVHGGFINWLSEGLGAFAFTNEMWTSGKYFQRDVTSPDEERMWLFRDRLLFGQAFKDYEELDHPEFGRVLVGGLNKWASRNTPTFMLEEECHRNFAFTMYHADQMPLLEWGGVEIERVGDADLWAVTVEVKNTKLIPTRAAIQADRAIGINDLLVCEPEQGARVVASGAVRDRRDKAIDEVRFEPARVQLPSGVPGKDSILHRFYVEGAQGARVRLSYQSEHAKGIETDFVLEPRVLTGDGP